MAEPQRVTTSRLRCLAIIIILMPVLLSGVRGASATAPVAEALQLHEAVPIAPAAPNVTSVAAAHL